MGIITFVGADPMEDAVGYQRKAERVFCKIDRRFEVDCLLKANLTGATYTVVGLAPALAQLGGAITYMAPGFGFAPATPKALAFFRSWEAMRLSKFSRRRWHLPGGLRIIRK